MHMKPRRIGLMIPANNVIIEPEFYSLGVRGVTFHADRLAVTGGTKKDLLEMLEGIESSAIALAGANPAVITYCCLSSSIIRGSNWDKVLSKRISRFAGGIPTVTAATASIEALRKLSIRRVVTYSAYSPAINEVLLKFLADNEIEVSSSTALNLKGTEVGNQGIESTFARISGLSLDGVDGLFIGSTDLGVMPIIERLENKIGVPIVTVNQALLKSALTRTGMSSRIPGYGVLLRS